MATFPLTKSTTVATLKELFNAEFGAKLRVYSGRSQAEDNATLGELGLTNEGEFACRASLTVGSFIERMQSGYGLKVKVYTQDDWVAALDGLTLAAAGQVKKQAVKADMEELIAYKRDDNESVDNESVDSEKSEPVAVEYSGDETSGAVKEQTGGVKFYRTSEDKILAGVCAGIARGFGIDPLIVRIVALLTVGFGFWGYVILWLLMPKRNK